jgi:hypothetical protein
MSRAGLAGRTPKLALLFLLAPVAAKGNSACRAAPRGIGSCVFFCVFSRIPGIGFAYAFLRVARRGRVERRENWLCFFIRQTHAKFESGGGITSSEERHLVGLPVF